jgi:hypothetical protein
MPVSIAGISGGFFGSFSSRDCGSASEEAEWVLTIGHYRLSVKNGLCAHRGFEANIQKMR